MKFLLLFMQCLFVANTFAQTLQWEALYNNSSDLTDYANDMTVDSKGNVYVTGESFLPGSGNDVATVKYSKTGMPLWVSRYKGAGDASDYGIAIATDADGNVYVAAASGIGTARDILTIKYDSAGNELWVKQYDGSANSFDIPIGMKIDASGNIYVAGQTTGSSSMLDYILIKYLPDGTESWVKTYNGAGSVNDLAYGMCIDDSFIYLTGVSVEAGNLQNFTTIKYSPGGSEVWITHTDSVQGDAKDVAVDKSGNVYITGYSTLDTVALFDYLTVKYSSSGIEQWVKRYDGMGKSHDHASSLAVNDSGDVYVTGKSTGINSKFDFTTIKYTTDGTFRWAKRYDSKKRIDEANAIVLDSAGNIYITGNSFGTYTGAPDFVTIKYDSSGVMQWLARNKGWVAGPNRPASIAIDDENAVIVSGYSDGGMSRSDYLTVKYGQGNVLWQFGETAFAKTFFGLEVYDANMAWVCGTGGTIFHTTDGGGVWFQQPTGPLIPDLLALSFPNVDTGYVVGKKGTIMKTTDGGDAWFPLTNASQNWTRADLHRVHFWNAETGYASGKKGTTLFTFDGGFTWTASTLAKLSTLNDIFYQDLSNGWGAGKKGALRKTTDSGTNWDTLKNGSANWTSLELSRIEFSDTLNGWTIGYKSSLLNTTNNTFFSFF